jgi:hypothetical protein
VPTAGNCICAVLLAPHRLQAAAQRKLDARSPRHAEQRSRQLTGRRSSGSASLPSSSTASQAASSSSTAGGLQQPRGPAAAADSIAINIIPDFGPRSRSGAAAAAGAGMTVGTSSSSSGTAAGTLSSGSTTHGAMGHHGSSEGAGSSASAAQRMFTRLWKYQQQDLPEHMLSGPSTARRSQEQSLRTAVTPLSSAAYTLSGSSSMGTVPTGTSAHTAAGVISSTQDQLGGHAAAPAPRSVSSSGTGAGTSGALSSQGMTVSSAGGQDSGSGAAGASGEIQPAPAKPVVGWLRRSSKRAGAESDVLPATDSGSGSSKAGSPAAPAGAGASKSSSSQADPDELQVCVCVCVCFARHCSVSFDKQTVSFDKQSTGKNSMFACVSCACRAGHTLHTSCDALHPVRPCTGRHNLCVCPAASDRVCAVHTLLAGLACARAVQWGLSEGRCDLWTHQDQQLPGPGEQLWAVFCCRAVPAWGRPCLGPSLHEASVLY